MSVRAPAGYAAIVVAAGRGTRAGGDVPKQWQMLAGRPVVAHALDAFAGFERRILAVHPDDMGRAIDAFAGRCTITEGGGTRADSVRAALALLDPADITHVLIHDAARPGVPDAVIAGVIAALQAGAPAAAPGLPVTDTLWRAEGDRITGISPRAGLVRAQTPQGFALEALLSAPADPQATDEVGPALAAGIVVTLTPGDAANEKITFPGDLARRAGERGMDVRLGNGFDVHALGPGDAVTLCGVRVPHEGGLVGHSDADVGMHALTDAILGALAAGDIGRHFPPSDPRWRGADSAIFLRHAAGLARAGGWRIGNADVTMVCEAPRIGPHAAAMATALAAVLEIDADRISVKATTSERLGFTGRGEGIAALATATLVRP